VSAWPAWLLVALGGALGTLLRFTLGGWVQHATGGTFPWGTFGINVAGALAIGALAAYADRGGALPAAWRIALQVGVLGGFTTFSSFGLETFRLVQDGDWSRATGYVLGTNVLGLAAVWIGYRVIERI
jgi:CrcB protein